MDRDRLGTDYDWADFIECDAKEVGLKITAWNLDRGSYCTLEYTEGAEYTVAHGEETPTHTAAAAYNTAKGLAKVAAMPWEEEDALADAADELKKELEAVYLTMLREEYEYRLSDEAIDEDILANEYLFTEEGKRTAVLNP